MSPADQRLAAEQFAARCIYLGLEVQHELVVGQRPPQLLFELDVGLQLHVELAAEETGARAAQMLGGVHRGVGAAHQSIDVAGIVGVQGHANASRHADLTRAEWPVLNRCCC